MPMLPLGLLMIQSGLCNSQGVHRNKPRVALRLFTCWLILYKKQQ